MLVQDLALSLHVSSGSSLTHLLAFPEGMHKAKNSETLRPCPAGTSPQKLPDSSATSCFIALNKPLYYIQGSAGKQPFFRKFFHIFRCFHPGKTHIFQCFEPPTLEHHLRRFPLVLQSVLLALQPLEFSTVPNSVRLYNFLYADSWQVHKMWAAPGMSRFISLSR